MRVAVIAAASEKKTSVAATPGVTPHVSATATAAPRLQASIARRAASCVPRPARWFATRYATATPPSATPVTVVERPYSSVRSAPLYVSVLRLPIKRAFATSLVVAAVLTVPATIVHASLGHVDWGLTLLLGVTAAPLAYLGGRVALASPSAALERVYGGAIAVLGLALLAVNH